MTMKATKRPKVYTIAMSLVPKLCLGMHIPWLCHGIQARVTGEATLSVPTRVKHADSVIPVCTVRMTRLMIAALCLIPAVGYCEPNMGTGHITVVWSMLLVVTGGIALIPTLLKFIGKVKMSWKLFWIFTLVPPLFFLIFVGPFFMIIGAFLLTGRTM